ncbi:hypothetical protein ACA910_022014 [Epithemia clementina (nom. ined.)]
MLSKGKIPTRSESMAYPTSNTATLLSKIQFLFRRHSKAVITAFFLVALILFVFSDYLSEWRAQSSHALRSKALSLVVAKGASKNWGGAIHDGYFSVEGSALSGGNGWRFAAVTDLDELSKVATSDKPQFRSVLMPGQITRGSNGMYTISFGERRELITKHNEAGRGAEFSELTIYNKRLLTFDDRTGDVFEILNTPDGQGSFCLPRFVITEGSGETDKGMKWEWSTVKDGELYMGSMGKKYTRDDGSVVNTHNLWIAILNAQGELRRVNWADNYEVVRRALHATDPGYLIIEAVNWSDYLNKWVFLPRRISSEKYNDVTDEKKGGNKIVLVDETFTHAEVVEISGMDQDPLRGFSTFAFVPGSKDRHMMAVRSVEEDCAIPGGECKQRSYVLIIDVLKGDVLSKEMTLSSDLKFEGLEFVNMETVPPKD